MKYLTILTLLIFSSCSSRSTNVANRRPVDTPVVPIEQANDKKWKKDDSMEFMGIMWVSLF